MPYTQNWGISRNAFQSPLNDNEPNEKSIFNSPDFGSLGQLTGREAYKQNFPNSDVDTDPNSDKDIIEANNELSAKQYFSNLSETRKEEEEQKEAGNFRDPVTYEWTNEEEFNQNMINNEDDYRNRYFNILDHSEGDGIVSKLNTILTQPKAVSDKLRSYLPGASEELVERMKNIKGRNKNFLTGLRKTAGNAAKGNTNAFTNLYGTDNLGLNKGTANFIQNEAANWVPHNVAGQTGIAIGTHARAAYEGMSVHESGRIIPKEWTDTPEKSEVKGAVEQASVYLPMLAKTSPWGKKFNTLNTAYQKLWKINKGGNTLTYGAGEGKNKEHMGNIKNILSSVLNKPVSAGMSKPKLSGTFGVTSAFTGKIASWFASKFNKK